MQNWKLLSKSRVESQELLKRAEEKFAAAVAKLAGSCAVKGPSCSLKFQSNEPFFCIERSLFFKRADLSVCGKFLVDVPSDLQELEPNSLNLERSVFYNEASEELCGKVVRKTKSSYALCIPPALLSFALADRDRAIDGLHKIAQRSALACVFTPRSKQAFLTIQFHPSSAQEPLMPAVFDRVISHALIEHGELFNDCVAKENVALQDQTIRCVDWVETQDAYFPWIAAICALADSALLFADEIADAAYRHPGSIDSFLPLAIDAIFDRIDYKKRAQPEPVQPPLLRAQTIRAFASVLSKRDLEEIYDRQGSFYANREIEEAQALIDLFSHLIAPVVRADLLRIPALLPVLESANQAIVALRAGLSQMNGLGWEAKLQVLRQLIAPHLNALRGAIDRLRTQIDPALWPLGRFE